MLLIAVLFIILSCGTAASSDLHAQITTANARRVHRVRVDASTSSFRPSSLEVDVGDWVVFELPRLGYTLSKSTLEHPCVPTHQFDSVINPGSLTNYTGPVVALYITARKSNWFFCQQLDPLSHCNAGKVFALNPGGKMNQFLQNARGHQTGNLPIVSATGLPAPTISRPRSTAATQSGTAAHATGMVLATGGAWTGWNSTHSTSALPMSSLATGAVIGTGTGGKTWARTGTGTDAGASSHFPTETTFHFPSPPSTILPSPPVSSAALIKSSCMAMIILSFTQCLVLAWGLMA